MIKVSGGLNDWYTLHYNNKPENAGKFEMLFDANIARPMSWQDASKDAALKIAERYDNIYLGLSGGLDSEHLANVFVENRIPFKPVVLCLPGSIDHHYAIKWCRDHNITPEIFEFEFNDRRLYPEVERLIRALGFFSHGCAVSSWLTNWVIQQKGHLVTGDPTLGQRYHHKPITDLFDVWWIQFTSQLLFPDYDHPAGFLNYTPEIFLSQALHLDTSLDDAESRAKLHNLPYRVKLEHPAKVISQRILDNIITIKKIRCYGISPRVGACEWQKQDLIKRLQHV